MTNVDPNNWFLPADRMPRGPAFTEGNAVQALVDGQAYYDKLLAAMNGCDRSLLVSGWRVSPLQFLNPSAPAGKVTMKDAMLGVRARGAEVRSLIYNVTGTNLPGPIRVWHGEDNRLFADMVVNAGGEAVLDSRLSGKPFSAHHQKSIVVRSSTGSTAFVGGIDVCLDRWDRPAHDGAAERQRDNVAIGGASTFYPSQPAWHDVQAMVQGPAVAQIYDVFANRWNGFTPENPPAFAAFRRRTLMPGFGAVPPPVGQAAVQVYQTLPCGTQYFGGGEQTVRLAHEQVIDRAQHFVYLEDQYLWPCTLVDRLEAALRRGIFVIAVVARDFDLPGLQYVHKIMRREVIDRLRAAGGDKFKVFHLQRPNGEQIYVHAKTLIVDDCYASIGSANFNHRSQTNDTELQVGIVDRQTTQVPFGGNIFALNTVCVFAHEYRRRLWAEHFSVPDALMLDPIAAIGTFWQSAAANPQGRVVPHLPTGSAADLEAVADFIISLIIFGVPGPGTLSGLLIGPITEASRPLLRPLIVGALQQSAVLDSITAYLKDFLNTRLVC